MQIKAAVLRDGSESSSIETLDLVDLRDDEVVVRIVATGVCHTDISCRNGLTRLPRPIVLGHEGAGVVEQVGATVTKVAPGDHVVLSYAFCGDCPSCKANAPYACHQFGELNMSGCRHDGSSALDSVHNHFFGQSSFASHSIAYERNVVKVRKDAPLELLGPLGCGVQTGAGSVMNVLRPRAGDTIAIFGGGGVGLSALMAAVVEKCRIIVVEPNAERRALALELGAEAAIDPFAGQDVVASIKEWAGGLGALHAFDTTGIAQVLSQAVAILAPRGKLALVSLQSINQTLSPPVMDMIGKSLTIHGVCEGGSVADEFVPKLVDLIMAGRFPLDKLVRYYDFADIDRALHDQDQGAVVKPIVRAA